MKTVFTSAVFVIFTVFVLGVGLSIFLTRFIDGFIFDQTVVSFIAHVRAFSDTHIVPERALERWPDPAVGHIFEDFVGDMRSMPSILSINIFNREGLTVFSTDAAKIGEKDEEDDVGRALAGEVVYVTPDAGESNAPGSKRIMEIYIPIVSQGQVLGVVELYLDQSNYLVLQGEMRRWVWGLIMGITVFISLLFFLVFRRQTVFIRQQLKKLSAIIDKSPIGIYTLNAEGVIDSFNPKMVEMAGAKNEEMVIGLNALELPSYKDAGLVTRFREGLAGKLFETEVRYVSSTGGKMSWRHYYGVPLFGRDDRTVLQLLLIVSDISEQKRLEHEVGEYTKKLENKVEDRTKEIKIILGHVEKEKNKFESLFNASPDCIKMIDVNGKLLLLSKGGFAEHSLNDQSKIAEWDYLLTIDRAYQKAVLEALRQSVSGVTMSIDVKHAPKESVFGGSNREWCNMTFSPIKNQSGDVVNVLVVSRDITERIHAELKINELNDLRKKFIQIVSHQLRTPLSSIRWNLEMLLMEGLGKLKKEQKEFIRLTYEADLEVIRRIHDLLTAMDIEEGRMSFTKTITSLESLLGSAMVDWKMKCSIRQIVCTYAPPKEPLPAVDVDADKIRDVFEKLLENALVYTSNKGKITVGFSSAAGFIRFEISDTGVGIPKVEQARIFTRFYRASNASTMKPDASGLGLSIAKYFVEQHGGTIGFTSVEGKGSTFWFELPAS